jgi:hypothetical protein
VSTRSSPALDGADVATPHHGRDLHFAGGEFLGYLRDGQEATGVGVWHLPRLAPRRPRVSTTESEDRLPRRSAQWVGQSARSEAFFHELVSLAVVFVVIRMNPLTGGKEALTPRVSVVAVGPDACGVL